MTALANQGSINAIEDGDRSPIHIQQQDDSQEYEKDDIERLKQQIDDELAKKRQENRERFEKGIKTVTLADDDEIIMEANLSKVFQNVEQQQAEQEIYEPTSDVYEDNTVNARYNDSPRETKRA